MLSAHLVVQGSFETGPAILAEVTRLMSEAFHIRHTTLQLEHSAFHATLDNELGMEH